MQLYTKDFVPTLLLPVGELETSQCLQKRDAILASSIEHCYEKVEGENVPVDSVLPDMLIRCVSTTCVDKDIDLTHDYIMNFGACPIELDADYPVDDPDLEVEYPDVLSYRSVQMEHHESYSASEVSF